jgi:hypothetical protein
MDLLQIQAIMKFFTVLSSLQAPEIQEAFQYVHSLQRDIDFYHKRQKEIPLTKLYCDL